jgi:hypothetical protein
MKFRTPIALICLVALGAASAAMAGEQKATTATPAAATTTADAKPKSLVKQCAAVTGTHIRPRVENECKASNGPQRSYSKDEIERTGQIDMAEALRRLDPSFH